MDIIEQRKQLLDKYNSDLTLWTLPELFKEYAEVCIGCWGGPTGPGVVSREEMKLFKYNLEMEIERRSK